MPQEEAKEQDQPTGKNSREHHRLFEFNRLEMRRLMRRRVEDVELPHDQPRSDEQRDQKAGVEDVEPVTHHY